MFNYFLLFGSCIALTAAVSNLSQVAQGAKALASFIARFSTPVDKAEYAEIDCYANFEAQWTMDRLFTRYNL